MENSSFEFHVMHINDVKDDSFQIFIQNIPFYNSYYVFYLIVKFNLHLFRALKL